MIGPVRRRRRTARRQRRRRAATTPMRRARRRPRDEARAASRAADPWRAKRRARAGAGRRARRRRSRAGRAVAASPAPATPYALPLDSLVAVAESAGLQWVNSDAAKIEAAQAAMAGEPQPIRVPREIPPVAAVDDGPLVLVETQEGPVAGQAAVRDDAARAAGPLGLRRCAKGAAGSPAGAFFFAAAQGRRSSERW